VAVGVPFAYWWGYPYWGYPYWSWPYWDYPYRYYWDGYYAQPGVVVYDAAPAAVAPAPQVRWYCPDSGYYPEVRSCERGWMRVVPGGNPPETQQ
jgi:hypothetical protein